MATRLQSSNSSGSARWMFNANYETCYRMRGKVCSYILQFEHQAVDLITTILKRSSIRLIKVLHVTAGFAPFYRDDLFDLLDQYAATDSRGLGDDLLIFGKVCP